MEKQKSGWIYGLTSILACFLILLPLLWYGFGADQGFNFYCAWAWRKFGLVPYRDIFEQNFPGLFLISYFIQAALGESVTAFRIFDLTWQTATAAMIYLVAASIFKNRLAGFLGSVFYCIYYLNLGPWHTGERDDLFLLIYLLTFRLLMRRREGRDPAYSALAGLLIGFAFLIKPVAGAAALVFLALAIKTARSKFRSGLAFIAGCSAPALAIIFYYWHLGALKDLYLSLFYFTGKIYLDYKLVDPLKLIGGILMISYLGSNALILLGSALLIPLRKRMPEEKKNYLFWLLLILIASYIGYLSQAKYGYYFFYHEAPVWGVLCVTAGGGWSLLIDFANQMWGSFRKTKTALFSAILILLSILMMWRDYRHFIGEALQFPPEKAQNMYPCQRIYQEAARYIRIRSTPEDKLQIWGGEPVINYFARRRAPSRFPSTLHLIPFLPGPESLSPVQKELGDEFLDTIIKDPPLYFIVNSTPYFYNPDIMQALIEDYPELWEFITSNYSHAATVDSFEIYLLNK